MLFRYDANTGKPVEVILVDLQLVQETCLTTDLAYAIYASTRTELRKNHLDELLQLYHDKFVEICVGHGTPLLPGFTMNELKRRFQNAKIFGFSCATTCLPFMLKEEENAVDLEKSDSDMDMMNMMKEVCGGVNEANTVFRDRVLEVVQEMYDEGII
jgi:hypothetical protein